MALLIPLAQLVLIGWLPGAAIFRLPWLTRDRRAALEAEERAFWGAILSVGVSLAIVLGLAIFHLYSFQRLLLADTLVIGLSAAVARGRLPFGPAVRAVTWTAL